MKKPIILFALSWVACGGSPDSAPGQSAQNPPSDTTPHSVVTRVTLTGVTSLAFQASTRISAVVEGTGDFTPEVTWSIHSGGGQLSATTGQTVTYTAPLVSRETPVTLYAVSQADPSRVGVLTLIVTAPPPAGEFLAGNYAGTESISKQEGDEYGQYHPPVAFTEETRPSTYRLMRMSDTQVRLSFFDGIPQDALMDIHPDGTLTLEEQDTGDLPQARCNSIFRIITGARTGSGTWDYQGNLTLNWPSRETRSCDNSGPGVPPESASSKRYTYREYRFTAVKDPKVTFPR